jgi:putative transcriptional regulator
MQGIANLTNHFLIAMPGLRDPNFARTVTYICEHTEKGAMGIVVNRPLDLSLADVLEHMSIEAATPGIGDQPVYLGGPVDNERGFVLHTRTTPWNSTLKVTSSIYITTSRDILEAMARGEGPERTLVALGYAGWAGGQLESEMQDNAWLSGPSDIAVLFDLPAGERWAAAARILGVDLTLLSAEAGHA